MTAAKRRFVLPAPAVYRAIISVEGHMYLWALACAGGALGAGVRHIINMQFLRLFGPAFPWATGTINVTGSFLMGLLAGTLAAKTHLGPEWRVFLGTGILGGYTTFSAFSLDIWVLFDKGNTMGAAAYLLGSIVLSLLALVAGLTVARMVVA